MISIDDFRKIELKIGKILAAERVEGSEKLMKLRVSLGVDERQIVAGIGKAYEPESLVDKEIIVVVNLEPRMVMGLESQGMLLAASGEDGVPVLLVPEREVMPGSAVR
ncbi:MAG: methionine--tRNA ligase subunit beta [bacterium]|nr:methionine--tRNA ligase subunit beta [bacterium]